MRYTVIYKVHEPTALCGTHTIEYEPCESAMKASPEDLECYVHEWMCQWFNPGNFEIISISKEQPKFPRIGVGVIIRKDGKVLLGKRKGSHGAGEWSFPGGHLEFNEGIEDCAIREVMEETGLKINYIRKATFTNDLFPREGKHYVTLFLIADWAEGEVENKEPHKCEGWEWFSWHKLPKPVFIPIDNLYAEGFNPFKWGEVMNFEYPFCNKKNPVEDDDTPWNDQEELNVTCHECERLFVVRAYLDIKHEIEQLCQKCKNTFDGCICDDFEDGEEDI